MGNRQVSQPPKTTRAHTSIYTQHDTYNYEPQHSPTSRYSSSSWHDTDPEASVSPGRTRSAATRSKAAAAAGTRSRHETRKEEEQLWHLRNMQRLQSKTYHYGRRWRQMHGCLCRLFQYTGSININK